MNTKQVIVIRKDLKMRRGKEIAQGCHASMAFLTRHGGVVAVPNAFSGSEFTSYIDDQYEGVINDWLKNSFKKVVVYVDSEEELLEIYTKAKVKGMLAELIKDSGATEFHGVPTNTCIAIGPDYDKNFEGITDHLPLY